jgi:Ser/Thr protein kinase RdoA (MazF antagonist)
LRKFHALTGVRDTGPDCLGETLRRCEERLLLIERTRDPRIPRRFSDDVMSFLNQQIAELHGERVAVTGRHGDFGPWNIIAGPEGVTVLDFMGYHEGPLPVDLLKMLIDVGYNEKHPLTQGRRADSLRARFLDGYGDLPAVQRPVLVVCETLHRLSGLLGCLRSEGDPLLRRVQKDRWLRDCLRWFTEEGSKVPTWPT